MPEGHVIHGIAAALTGLLRGQVVHASSPQGRFSSGAALLDGCTFTGAIAHGKHLFASFDPGAQAPHILHVHLGLYGVWSFALAAEHPLAPHRNPLLTAAGEGKQPQVIGDAARFAVPAPRGAVRLRLVGKQAAADLNGPSRCEVLTAAEVDVLRARLGPDPLLGDSDPDAFIQAVRSSRRAIGELLMDQSVISGVGNIYRAELLFRHRIHPATPGQRVSVRKLQQLWSDAVVLLADGKRLGVIVTTDEGHLNEPPTGWTKLAERAPNEEADLRWYAYRRSGRPCHRCGNLIATSILASRTVFWCSRCQRAPSH
ncbi:Fpg/Nei family DNA glycosylase [Myxococcus sp. AB036A]|uniref:Fpg/Nei family DNA glycosylase n=1 Tax=Myxococcus sp. AB036A TaxID=2562793 RepID=UPI0011462BB4|nr:DNA-formamidopyrimidine glycosylase family protein [Myxococcus sp. AB036A]